MRFSRIRKAASTTTPPPCSSSGEGAASERSSHPDDRRLARLTAEQPAVASSGSVDVRTTVDVVRRAGDVAGLLPAQVRDEIGDVVDGAVASDGDAREQLVLALAFEGAAADAGSDFKNRVESDLGFHLLLCELADNPMLVESLKHLEGRIQVAIMSHSSDQLPGIMSRDRHAPIVDAIEAGDAAAARAVVEQHMAVAADLYASS